MKEAVHALVFPHENDVLAVQPNVEGAEESAGDSDEGENKKLLGVEREVHGEVGDEHGGYGLLALEPDGEQPEHGGAANGGEEAAPVVSDREVDGRDLDAEEHAADRGGEARGYPYGTGRGQHLAVAALVLVDALEARDQLRQQGRDYARYVDERTWSTHIITRVFYF